MKTHTPEELHKLTDAELDAVVARDVMGWQKRDGGWWDSHGAYLRLNAEWSPTGFGSDCCEVITRMVRRGMDLSIYPTHVRIRPFSASDNLYVDYKTSTSRAICEAAVLATQAWRAARKGR